MTREEVLKLTPAQRARVCVRHYYSAQTKNGVKLVSCIDGFTWQDSPNRWWDGTIHQIDRQEPVSLLKDYGSNDEQAYKDFAHDYPPLPVTVYNGFYGWLSPDGLLYKAEYEDHSGCAEEIVQAFDLEHEIFTNPQDCLYFRGWISIGMVICLGCQYDPSGVSVEQKMTPEQKAVIDRLIAISTNSRFLELAKEFLSWQE